MVDLKPIATQKKYKLKPDSLEKDTAKRKNLLIAFPAVYYTPETRFGYGLAGIYNYYPNKLDTISPSSQLQLAASYTQNEQILLFLPFRNYWDNWGKVVEGELGYYDYIYPYYGIGDASSAEDFEQYSSKYFRFQIDAFKRVKNQTFLGLRYWFDNPDIYEVKEDGLLDLMPITGSNGGVISGIGPQVRIDKRDNIYSSRNGHYINAIYQTFQGFMGSNFAFNRLRLDGRKYWELGKNVLATQVYSDINWGHVPFFQQARLGGTKRLRGYLEGRFTDKLSFTPQAEWRFPIWKRVGGVAFYSSGTVAPDLKGLANSKWLNAGGLGLRFTLDTEKQVKVRIDYAFTPEGTNFYFTVGESF